MCWNRVFLLFTCQTQEDLITNLIAISGWVILFKKKKLWFTLFPEFDTILR
jgi:hypothetical protein